VYAWRFVISRAEASQDNRATNESSSSTGGRQKDRAAKRRRNSCSRLMQAVSTVTLQRKVILGLKLLLFLVV